MKIGFVLVYKDGEYCLWDNKVLISNTKEEAECLLELIERIEESRLIIIPEVYYEYDFNKYTHFEDIVDDFIKVVSGPISSLS